MKFKNLFSYLFQCGRTALHLAIVNSQYDIALFLLERKADANISDEVY